MTDMELSSGFWNQFRVPLTALAALIVVLVGIFAILWWQSHGYAPQKAGVQLSEEQKLQILVALKGMSSTSEAQKTKTLESVSSALHPTDEEKLKTLQSLHNK